MACVNLPEFPLQILLLKHPDWAEHPVAVVDRDTPTGHILSANRPAREHRILPGMRYATALSLAWDLRAEAIAHPDVARWETRLRRALLRFSPRVEATDPADPLSRSGRFWLQTEGLDHLYPSLTDWADAVQSRLATHGFHAVIAIGFSRFACATHAEAPRATPFVFSNPDDEERSLRALPLTRLDLPYATHQRLNKLGITSVGDFMDLPADGLRKRFGTATDALHQLACGDRTPPLARQELAAPVHAARELDYPETSSERLTPLVVALLEQILTQLAERREALAQLYLDLYLDAGQHLTERLAPASPSQDAALLQRLIRLRIEHLTLPSGIIELRLRAHGAPIQRRQQTLFPEASGRDPLAAQQALATLRAALGNDAVAYAALRPGHLPEASFEWLPEPARVRPTPPEPSTDETDETPSVVRRLYTPPRALPYPQLDAPTPDAPPPAPASFVQESRGPYTVRGGWWKREVSRAYYYVHTHDDRWLWVFFDRRRERWFLQGEIQ